MEALQDAPPDQSGEGIGPDRLFVAGKAYEIFLHEFLVEGLPDHAFGVVQEREAAVVAVRGFVMDESLEVGHLVVVRPWQLVELVML